MAALKRNPDRTRGRILAAAQHEFAAKGFAGARVDAIARRARSNKRMLYHYFGDKKGLFEATVQNILEDKRRMMDAAPHKLEDVFTYLLEFMQNDREWTRMLQWEALAYGEQEVLAEPERRAGLARGVEHVIRLQKDDGVLHEESPEFVLLVFMALCSYPALLPQITRMVTGLSPSSDDFRREYGRALGRVARALQAPSRLR